MRREAATPSVAVAAASAASQLLMTAGMNGHDPIAYEWNVRQASRYCTHLQISMDTHTHTLWDMARWCNPLVFCVSYPPPHPPNRVGITLLANRIPAHSPAMMRDEWQACGWVSEWGGHAVDPLYTGLHNQPCWLEVLHAAKICWVCHFYSRLLVITLQVRQAGSPSQVFWEEAAAGRRKQMFARGLLQKLMHSVRLYGDIANRIFTLWCIRIMIDLVVCGCDGALFIMLIWTYMLNFLHNVTD